jgi:hypothetical protein
VGAAAVGVGNDHAVVRLLAGFDVGFGHVGALGVVRLASWRVCHRPGRCLDDPAVPSGPVARERVLLFEV